jgi:hypothetical protein
VGATCPLGHLLSEAVVLLDGPEVGGLSEDGTSPKQLQRLLTHEVEQGHYRTLGKEIMLLPRGELGAHGVESVRVGDSEGVGDFLAEAHYYDVARCARDRRQPGLLQRSPPR